MAWEKIGINRMQGGKGTKDYCLRLSTHSRNRLAVTVREKMLRRMKWKTGDRIHFMLDRDAGVLGLQRTNDSDGFILSSQGGTPKGKRCKHAVAKVQLDPSLLAKMVNGSPRVFDLPDLLIDDDQDIVSVELL